MNEFTNIPELESFRDTSDKYESLYTIVAHQIPVNDLKEKLFHKLNFIKTIKNSCKRKYLNDRLYTFIEYLDENKVDQIINNIFLIGQDINEIHLSKIFEKIIHDYNIDHFIFKYGEKFEIDYLNELFNDLTFRPVIYIMNTRMEHILLNRTKRKVLYTEDSKELNLLAYLQEKVPTRCVVHGVSGNIKNLKTDNHFVINKQLTDEEILKVFDDYNMTQLHNRLIEIVGYLSNEKMMNRVAVGKDLEKGIKNHMIKTLFCTTNMYEKLFKVFPKEYLNFEIIQIYKLKEGDIADTLDKNYRGIIGVTYY